MSRKDVKKTEIKRNYNSKRKRVRKNNALPWLIYFVIIILLVGVAFFVFSRTVLFNVKTIIVSGTSKHYTSQKIANATKVDVGDNLFSINLREVEERVEENLPLIEKAKCSVKLPDTLIVTVSDAEEVYSVETDGKFIIASRSGKVISIDDTQKKSTVLLKGFEPKETAVGKMLTSKDSQRNGIFDDFANVLDNDTKITAVDASDKYDINIIYDPGIEFHAGSLYDIEYKTSLAKKVLENQGSVQGGYMEMIGSNQISYRKKTDVEESEKKKAEGLQTSSGEEESHTTTQVQVLGGFDGD